ncbi:MAG: flagellar hook-associated protein FlgL [Calditrichia bacterium]
MRVTQNYSVQTLLQTVAQSRERIYGLQRDIATGKKINTMSDDPEHIEIVMRYKNLLNKHERFEKNLEKALDFMNISSQALDDISNALANAKELAVQSINTTNEGEWQSLAEQIDQILGEVVDLSNTRFAGRYVFAGSRPNEQPFQLRSDGTAVDANPNGVDGELKVEFGDTRIGTYNVSGQKAFLDGENVFQVLIDLRDAIRAQDTAAIQSTMSRLDTAHEQVVQQNGNLGAQINRYEQFLEQYHAQDLQIETYLSKTEDVDMAQAVTDLQIQQTGLETALKVLAQTLNISLVDYLR